MTDPGSYEVYAVKYAERDARRPEHFLGGDPHDVPMPMDYFVWAIVGRDRTIVVDTGFNIHDAELRNRRLLRTAAEGLTTIGVDASTAPRWSCRISTTTTSGASISSRTRSSTSRTGR